MDVGSPKTPSSDFGFAFNDVNFSDRVLVIEILPDSPGSSRGPEDSLSDWGHNRKRRRDDRVTNVDEPTEQCEEQIMNCNVLDLEDEAVDITEECTKGLDDATEQAGLENAHEKETSDDVDYSPMQVKSIHISSPILAAQSPYFYKLFSNGMKESEQRQVVLRIHAAEEGALMDLLSFMYSNTLPRTTPTSLLDVLMAADKYEVASCMRYCSRLLRNIPMSCESALLYLDLPSTLLMADIVQPLSDAAKQFLAARFKEISKFQDEVLSLPLAGIEAILSSDDLHVASEDAVYDLVLKWARAHHSKLDERRDVLSARLLNYVRFPYMSSRKLRKVLTSPEIDSDVSSKVVLDALFFKSEAPYRQRSLAAEDQTNNPSSSSSQYRRFVERAYKYRPVRVVEFDSPRQQCIVYLDLKRDECLNLYPSGRVYSQAFHLGGQGFFLSGHCNLDQQSSFHCFGLFLGMQEKGSTAFTVDYEFASRTKPSEEFACKYKGSYTFTGGKAVGYRNLFGVPWNSFVADDSVFFVGGVLHLRAELTIKK